MVKNERRSMARMKGYEGEPCPECQNFYFVAKWDVHEVWIAAGARPGVVKGAVNYTPLPLSFPLQRESISSRIGY